MKYLKTYEENKPDFNVGDYVQLYSSCFKDKLTRHCKIFSKINPGFSTKDWYECIMINGHKMAVSGQMIERKLTDIEIEEFQIKFNTQKYNL